ncbi:MAG: amino acid decarboxylase [Clostridiales bacterium]|nr:amino acid decarboxylase [Clostridiales bacterium]
MKRTRGSYPFHMPGHKRNRFYLPQNLLELDITEIPGADNLHAPEGLLRELQEDIAAIYGADESFLLVNGASSGITAAICAACREGESAQIARNAHISVYNGLVFSGASPVYLMPGREPGGIVGGILPSTINGRAAATVVTSPTYEGFVSDIESIAGRVHSHGGILIVDEAHGAHFPFHSTFPRTALNCGADITVNSLHKTLPALSQCAALHVKGNRVDREKLRFYVRAFQTTSPSYMMMAAAGYALRMLREQPEHFERYAERLKKIRRELPGQGGEYPVALCDFSNGSSHTDEPGIFACDAGKLLFRLNTRLSGGDVLEVLRERYKLELEMARGRYLLAMTSVADTDEGFARLTEAIEELNRELPYINNTPVARGSGSKSTYAPEVVYTPRDALRRKSETADITNAKGRVSAEFVVPYPPGIPLLVPGERITGAFYAQLKEYRLTKKEIKILQ